MAYAISPNAKYLGGLAVIDNCYTPVAWNLETGEMTKYFIHNLIYFLILVHKK